MAYDDYLAERITQLFNEKRIHFRELKMMGGIAYLVNDKMCVGIISNDLMARVGPEIYQEALKRKGAREMDFTKRPMKGWIVVEPEGIDSYEELSDWVQLALDFNPRAKRTKKK